LSFLSYVLAQKPGYEKKVGVKSKKLNNHITQPTEYHYYEQIVNEEQQKHLTKSE
jgi:hypothetical protein